MRACAGRSIIAALRPHLVRLFERVLRGKLTPHDADKHALKMAIDAWIRERLTELQANMQRVPEEFLKEEAA